jgi:hypothetical protein
VVVNGAGMVSLELNFWSLESEHQQSESPDFSIQVHIPSTWTSQMYIDALSYTVKKGRVISVNTTKGVIGRYNTVNEVNLLYQFDLSTVKDIIGL